MPAVASPAAIVTPTIDEAEQASFYASGNIDDAPHQVSFDQDQEQYCQLALPVLESVIDIALPSSSFHSPAGADESLESYIGSDKDVFDSIAFRSISSLASLAAAADTSSIIADLTNKNDDSPQETILEETSTTASDNDEIEAAEILCRFKNDNIMGIYSTQDATDIVDMAVDMLSEEKVDEEEEDDMEEAQHFYEHHQEIDAFTDAYVTAPKVVDSLVHPDRLAADDDAEEVNKLHQYVRSDLLEIFVVPQVASTDSSDNDEDQGSDDEVSSRVKKSVNAARTTSTRRLVTRGRSISISASSPSALLQRHYPGRIGLRCVHCANIRRKSTSKAAFYPLRLKNIYREVCAWQRIHFKKCPHVPEGVRQQYANYKRIDTSRGKVRYWESSARKIGLQNNPDRDDGVVFATTAWKL